MIGLINRLKEMLHIPRKIRKTYYVDGSIGHDVNTGRTTEDPFLTITQAITAAVDGDMICIAEGTYDENGLDFGSGGTINGLEIIFEPGVILNNTNPGTVLTISGDGIRVKGHNTIISQAGQTGVAITGASCLIEDVATNGCTTGWSIASALNTLRRCRSHAHDLTGFDISEDNNHFDRCISVGDTTSIGWHLSHANADNNVFEHCVSMANVAGVTIIAGADFNMFDFIAIGSGEVIADAGANNTFPGLSEGSQIVAGQSRDQDIADIHTRQDSMLFSMDFWSDPMEELQVAAAAGTLAITPTVDVADLPAGATIVRAIAMFKFRMIENTYAGVNKLDGATVAATSQVIQVKETTAGAYVDAINCVDDQFTLADSAREGGDVLIGSIDISGEVDDNDNYTFQWLLANADQDFINFNDLQVGLRIWYSI